MSHWPTSTDTRKHTSSAESPAGRSHSNSPDGRQMLLFGPAPVPASPTRQPAKDSETQTPETSGPLSFGSSASAALQSSLANRLLQQFATGGSMEYAETWKLKATPAERQFWEHTASARRTSGKGYSGWPTATVRDIGSQSGKSSAKKQAELGHPRSILAETVLLTGWCSPTAQDHSRGGLPPRPQDTGIPLSQQVTMLTGWATPRREDSESTGAHNGTPDTLHSQTQLSGWATPQHCDGRGATGPASKNRELGRDVLSSTAATAKPAASAINPAMSRWLMGFPPSWDQHSPGFADWRAVQDAIALADSEPTETPLCQK